MKQLVFAAALILALPSYHGICARNYGYDRYVSLAAEKIDTDSPMDKEVIENHVNSRAIRHFNKAYSGNDAAEWSFLKEGGFVCRFTRKKIVSRAFYDKKGNWLYTVAGYTEDKLAKEIRAMVRRVYYDYQISFINEINMPEGKNVYIIQIQDEKTLKILRISEDEMEIVQEFINPS
jgi:hypothetical protein